MSKELIRLADCVMTFDDEVVLDKINLSIRVNINRDNAHEFIEVYHYLHELLNDPSINIYPGIIREDTTDGCALCYSSLNSRDYFELLKQCAENDIPVNFMPKHIMSKNCMINHLNSFIIGPKGELYKCWNDFNHHERVIGYIFDTEFSNRKLFLQYMTQAGIHSDPKCKSCLIFPACSGGCGYHRLKTSLKTDDMTYALFIRTKTYLRKLFCQL